MYIDLLNNHPEAIPKLAEIWLEVLGKIWAPDVTIDKTIQKLHSHLNGDKLPLTFVAFYDAKPIGMCSLRDNDGIRPDLSPWLGSLVVDPRYQKHGVGKKLIDATEKKAKDLGYQKLYLFAFDPTIDKYYERIGYNLIGEDEFRGHSVRVMQKNSL